jgi:PAS domain S-box-containing protein
MPPLHSVKPLASAEGAPWARGESLEAPSPAADQPSKGWGSLRSAWVLVGLIAAGLAGNYFKFTLFFNADFIFGSIFAMLVLQIFGLGRGVVAALIISCPLFLLWGHPYATIFMTAEVAVVGWLSSRQKIGLIQADALYWLCIGMPLIYVFYHLVLKIPQGNALFIMAKAMMNGVANILVARLLFTAISLRSGNSLISYRDVVYNLVIFFVLCPPMIMMTIAGRKDFNTTDRQIRTALIQDGRRMSDRVETWVVNRKSAIFNLAELAASKSPQQMQPYLEQAKKSDINFLKIGLHDRSATTTACYPLIDDQGQKNIGKNFADRPFIPMLQQTLKPMLSEVVLDRVGDLRPHVTLLAPVVIDGAYGGYVIGVLSLDQIREHLDKSSDGNALLYTLLDKNGKIIMTNRPNQKIMEPFVRGKGNLNRLDGRLSQWVPTMPPISPATERWGKSFYVLQSNIGRLAEWKLILEAPVAPFQSELYDRYSRMLATLLLLLVLSLVVAEVLSRLMTRSLAELGTLTHDLPIRLATEGSPIHWPESSIQESNQLISNFRRMAGSLSDQFTKVRQTNASLEQRVEERTNQLASITRELNSILDIAPVGISKIIDSKQTLVNRKIEEMFQYPKEEMELQTTRKFYASDEAYETFGQEAYPALTQGQVFETVQELIRKDGHPISVRYVGKALDPQDPSKGSIWLLEDISERRQSELALKESEARFRNFFEKNTSVMLIIDSATGGIVDANASAAAYYGYARPHLVGMHIRDINTLTPEGLAEELKNAYQENHSYFISHHRLASGDLRDVEVHSTPIESGGRPLLLSIVHDISARTQFEKALKESEHRYRRITEGLTDYQYTVRVERGRAMATTHGLGCEKVTGYAAEDFAADPYLWFKMIPPEESEAARARVDQILEGKELEPFEHRIIRKDGALRWVSDTSILNKDASGRLLSYDGIVEDITERKQAEDALRESEARFRGLLQSVDSVAVQSYGPDGTTHYWNQASERLYGYTAEEAVGRSLLDLTIPPDMRGEVTQALRNMWETGQPIPSLELSLVRKDGSRVTVYSSHAIVRVPGHAPEMFCMDVDLTDRKRLEAQLHQSQKMESLGILAGGVAHDMNNVLGAILGLASVHLETQPPESPAHRAFTTISTACIRGGSLIQSLLGFARQGLAEEKNLDLNALVQDQVRLLERTTLARVSLKMDLAADLRPIRGDASALTHVLMNLCVNAVDAMPDNGTLTLRTHNVDADWIEIQVEDTGIGMPKEVLEKALDPFFTTKDQGKGTGLGLSIAHSTVMAHHGQMEIQSKPGQGTKVLLRFPASETRTLPAEAAPVLQWEPSKVSLKVLLVDDDALIQSSMQAILEALGHSITAVFNGEDALVALESGLEPDLVILDMNMPGLGGAGTLPHLRALQPTVPVLLATGRADQTAVNLIEAHPFVTLLPKPFGMKELQQHLESVGRG